MSPSTPEKPNLSEIMQAAQDMQKTMQQAQEEFSKLIVTGESGAGLVSVDMNCLGHVTGVRIAPGLFEESREVAQTLIAAAFNEAAKKSEKRREEKILDLAKGFNFTKDQDAL